MDEAGDALPWTVLGQRCGSEAQAALIVERAFWVSYRSGMEPLSMSKWTTDSGWGCMVRSAQMQLAHAWQRALCGDAWADTGRPPVDQPCHAVLVRWFTDHPVPRSPFSLHHIAARGREGYSMAPGEWYGPHKVASVLRDLLASHGRLADGFLRCVVASGGTLFVDQLHELCADGRRVGRSHPALPGRGGAESGAGPGGGPGAASGAEGWGGDGAGAGSGDGGPAPSAEASSDDEWADVSCGDGDGGAAAGLGGAGSGDAAEAASAGGAEGAPLRPGSVPWEASALVWVPLRLGLGRTMDGRFWPSLRRLLTRVPQCVGVVGGTPRHSLFFLGVGPGDRIPYLDPHRTQPTPPLPPSEGGRSDSGSSAGSSIGLAASVMAQRAAAATGMTGWLDAAPRARGEPPSEAEGRAGPGDEGAPSASAAGAPPPDDPGAVAGESPPAPPPPLGKSLSAASWDPAPDPWATEQHAASFHFASRAVRTTTPDQLDSSMAVGFFVRDGEDCASLVAALERAEDGVDAALEVERRTPAWMLATDPATGARAVPTYREQFGLGPMPASPRPDGAPPSKRRADPPPPRATGEPVSPPGWERVPREVEEDEESGFQVVSLHE